jgi:hypothetical protein
MFRTSHYLALACYLAIASSLFSVDESETQDMLIPRAVQFVLESCIRDSVFCNIVSVSDLL